MDNELQADQAHAQARQEQVSEAYAILCCVTAQAARGALSHLSADDVALELEALASAIRDPGSVAEAMYAIPQIPRATWLAAGVDFSEMD
jgi:hypothetical protein